MPFFWKRLWGKSSPPRQTNPPDRLPPPAPVEPAPGYPNTYRAGAQGLERPQVFEPALQHFGNAFRHGDPVFPDPEIRRAWYEARRGVLDHLLQLLAASAWRDHLVLRGSLLLKAWLGDAAREPGDIDWVFRPTDVKLEDPRAGEFFDDLLRMASEHPRAGSAVIEADDAAVDEIWTYERADGRRIVLPWSAEGLPPGSVQMDVVFGEELFVEPIQTFLPASGGGVSVWSADKELSLAWKLLWLETDVYPQGKDLYDATLLAEQTQLRPDLLHRLLQHCDGYYNQEGNLPPDFPLKWDVDWDNFKKEYPWIEGEAEDWQARLYAALAPTFVTGY